MKKIILATTVLLLALGLNACKDQKKDETSTAQEQVAPAGEEHKAEGDQATGSAAEMGKKVDEAVTDVKKDVENAAAHASDAADSAAQAKDAAAQAKDAAKDAAAPAAAPAH
jgi:hypothetical protein